MIRIKKVGYKNMKKRVLVISIVLIILCISGIGVTYSLWNISISQDSVNMATTKCFNVEITSQNNNISLENAFPITNEKGKKLTPFSFTITNTCDIFASYTVSLESLKETTLASKFLNAMINNEEIKKLSDYEVTDTVNTGSIESHILAKGSLGSGDSEDYTLRVWIDYDTTMEDLDNKTKNFKSKVVVKAEPSSWSPVDEGYTTLHDAILANEYQSSPEVAIKKIEAKGTPDLSQPAPNITWKEQIDDKTYQVDFQKASSEMLGIDNYTSELQNSDTKLKVYTNYRFDSSNGSYHLTDLIIADPTELDFNNNDYYIITDAIFFDGEKIVSTSYENGYYIYKIKSATKKIIAKNINEIEYKVTNYSLNVETYKQKEIEDDTSSKGVYQDIDDYGITYYYRGNVNNNNVLFAGFYWQIIRINGDGTIRLLYNGQGDNDNKSINYISKSTFNINNNSIAYVGYMYGNDISSYENAKKNEKNSTIKNNVDAWYANNLKNTLYEQYLADTGYCSDRTLPSIVQGNDIILNPRHRIYNLKTATFKCSDIDNDLFTTKNGAIGNKALIYPIGLITSDEIMYSGLTSNSLNTLAYTYSSNTYWTMSPSYQSKIEGTYLFSVDNLLSGGAWSRYSYGIRPVINLRADVEITGGIGTKNSPYVIKTN